MNRKNRRDLFSRLEKQGWRVELGSKHYRLYSPNKGVGVIFAAVSPSDWREDKNLRAELRRAGADL